MTSPSDLPEATEPDAAVPQRAAVDERWLNDGWQVVARDAIADGEFSERPAVKEPAPPKDELVTAPAAVGLSAAPLEALKFPPVIERLQDRPPKDRLVNWTVTLAITAFAFILRFINISRPKNLVFDETYYPKDAWGMLKYGYEADYVDKANDLIRDGKLDNLFVNGKAAFVVHPPLGKWLIAGGEYLFGMNSFGWRFGSLIFGTLLIFFTIRLARRLSRSTLVGAIAGILLSLDGLAFVMSRIGLLDIFQATFLVAAVSAVVADRDWFRNKLAAHLIKIDKPDLDGAFGPALLIRPWRVAAGIMFGCAIAVKWNSVFVLATFGILSVLWDVSSRQLAGAQAKAWWGLLRDGIPAFISMVILAIPVYMLSWIRWFQTQGGYDRQWGAQNPNHVLTRWFGEPLASWLWYHRDMYNFHRGDYIRNATHVYEANPAGWLVMQRPIGIDAINGIKPGVDGCTAAANDTCLRVISGLGTPLLWWAAAIALVAGLIFWLAGRDWRFSVPVLAALSTWLPWFPYADRPLFFFYAITIIPFTTICLALCIGKFIGKANGPDRRYRSMVAGVLVGLIAANFAFFYPIYTDTLLTRKAWSLRMWFSSWI